MQDTAGTGQYFERFNCHRAADNSWHRSKDAIAAAVLKRFVAIFIKTSITGRVTVLRTKYRELPLHPYCRSGNKWPALSNTGVVDRKPGREVVAAIENDGCRAHGLLQLVDSKPAIENLVADVGVANSEPSRSDSSLAVADVTGAIQELAAEVTFINPVEVIENQRTDPCTGQVTGDGAANTANADDKRGGIFNARLSTRSDLFQGMMSGCAS